MKMKSALVASMVVAATGLGAAGDAAAQTAVARGFVSNPTGLCQGALPAFETAIRKRPLAVQNEGTSNAFVTCSFTSQGNIDEVQMWFRTTSGAATPISCTAVTGYDTGPNEFVTKSISATADGEQVPLVWTGADFTGAPAVLPSAIFSVSCTLPPGAVINDSYLFFDEVTPAPTN